MATAEERLAGVAGRISQRLAPDALAGDDQCAHGTWPCAVTEAAWLAQGRDRDEELRSVREAVTREALIQDAERDTQQELEAASREGRRAYRDSDVDARIAAGA